MKERAGRVPCTFVEPKIGFSYLKAIILRPLRANTLATCHLETGQETPVTAGSVLTGHEAWKSFSLSQEVLGEQPDLQEEVCHLIQEAHRSQESSNPTP